MPIWLFDSTVVFSEINDVVALVNVVRETVNELKVEIVANEHYLITELFLGLSEHVFEFNRSCYVIWFMICC